MSRKHKDFYLHYTDPIPDDLLGAVGGGRCTVLLGAGLSRGCLSKARTPLPDWNELLRNLLSWSTQQHLLRTDTSEDLMNLIDRCEFLMAAQELREQLGDDKLAHFISDVFDPDAIVPSRAHELLAAVPFRAYLTTNYDNLLERSYMQVHNRQLQCILARDIGLVGSMTDLRPHVLKLHGDIETPSTIVLSHQDYLRPRKIQSVN